MKKRKITSLATAGVLVLSVLLTGCGTSNKTASGSPAPAGASPAATGTAAPAKDMKKITIMGSGLEKLNLLPLKLAETLGYYKEEGLNVELVNSAAGQNAEEALIAGEIAGVGGFYDHTIDLQAKGKNIESVVQLISVPGMRLMVSDQMKDKIKSIKDLKGTKIGVTGLGSSTDFLANYLTVKGGYAKKDYTPVPVGSGSTLIAAMQAGKIDLAVATEPTVSMLLDKKLASVLVDMATAEGTQEALGGLYPASSLYMQNDYVKKNPETAQKLANALVKTLKYINTHTAEEITEKVPVEYLAGDKELYIKTLKSSKAMYTPDGQMPAEGPQKVLEVLTSFNPKLKDAKIDLQKTFTNDFTSKVK